MTREVISKSGAHYRLDPTESCIVQVQPGHGQRWRTFAQYATEAEARGRLAQLGRLQAQPETQPEGGSRD